MGVNGYQGQIIGSYEQKIDLFEIIKQQAKQDYNPEAIHITRIGIETTPGIVFKIGGNDIKIGKTGTYEACNLSLAGQQAFLIESNPYKTPTSSEVDLIIDYTIMNGMN